MQKTLAGRYALEAEIARGAIGTVWRARDLTTGEPVAVKVLLPETAHDPDVVKALLDEAEILAQLNHPGIVRARDVVANGLHALVMDLVEGVDVRRRLRTGGPLHPAEVARIGAETADALAAVHAAGIVHGDVKPGNILLPGDGGAAKLGDFGVARRIQLPDTVTHATPEYVAPEVIAGGHPMPGSDVYSLGMVLYEMACGRSPYRGGSVTEVIERHARCAPVQPVGMPDELWRLVLWCVEPEPAGRPSAEQVAAELRRLAPRLASCPVAPALPEHAVTNRPRLVGAEDRSVLALFAEPVSVPPERPQAGRSRMLAFVAVAAALLLFIGLGAGILVWSSTEQPGTPAAADKPPAPSPTESEPTGSPEPTPSRSPEASPSGSPEQPESGSGEEETTQPAPAPPTRDHDGRPGIGDPMPTMPR